MGYLRYLREANKKYRDMGYLGYLRGQNKNRDMRYLR